MPYVKKDRRAELDELIYPILSHYKNLNEGDYNYLISKILWTKFINNRCYSELNKIVGILECIKIEFYRRLGSKLEDEKKDSNGDLL